MDENEHPTGYAKPPSHSQFKRGQSGNPSGKRKGTRNFSTDLIEELQEQVSVSIDGGVRQVTKQRAVVIALVSAAISGDLRATAIVMSHLTQERAGPDEEPELDTEKFGAVNAHRKLTKK
jgi:hypothetical protein